MKLYVLIPAGCALVAILCSCANALRNEAGKKKASNSLPPSCTLMAMTPKERKGHEQRLRKISETGRNVQLTNEGFIFQVDLSKIGLSDLREWAEKEQECCSFLSIEPKVIVPGKIADVIVDCPIEFRDSVLDTFGLLHGKSRD